MSKCEACGGDGRIEYGAYRGDEDDENTRECRLCGGVVTTATGLAAISPTAAEASAALTRLGQAASKTGITLKSSLGGVRVPEVTLETERHQHQWAWLVKGQAVQFYCVECNCRYLFSAHGSLLEGRAGEASDMQYLSRQAVRAYENHVSSMKTAKEVAAERLEQLKRENERRQHEAEQHEHIWDSGTVGMPYGGDLTDRRIDIRCVLCKEILIFNTGGGLVQGEVEEPQLSELALRARNAALKDKIQRRARGML